MVAGTAGDEQPIWTPTLDQIRSAQMTASSLKSLSRAGHTPTRTTSGMVIGYRRPSMFARAASVPRLLETFGPRNWLPLLGRLLMSRNRYMVLLNLIH